jgi:hypothetical protein
LAFARATKSLTVCALEVDDTISTIGVSARCATGTRSRGGSKESERLIQGGIVTWAADAISSV